MFVPLESVSQAEGVWDGISQALQLPAESQSREGVLDHLSKSRARVILDNAEQIIGFDGVVQALLQHTRDVSCVR